MHYRHLILCIKLSLFVLFPLVLVAQQSGTPSVNPGAPLSAGYGQVDMAAEMAPINDQIDLFHKTYRYPSPQSTVYDTLLTNTYDFKPGDVPKYSPQIINKRMYDLPMIISTDYNSYVQRYIDIYTLQRREQTSRMLGLARVYFPIFEETFDREGLPIELKYLAVVESALNPHARSRVGATGLWQFMLSTGKLYGLRVTSYVDERRDPYKSTEAAAQYLKNAYQEFGDWLLAIASYNCGPGNVRKAIIRSGGKRTFWEIRAYLPRETRGYVPAFLAVMYTFNYAGAHNIYPVYPDFTHKGMDTLHLRKLDISLPEIATMTGSNVEVLRYLNPELKLDRIPYNANKYVLRVPFRVSAYFAGHQGSIRTQYGRKRNQTPSRVVNTKSPSKSYTASVPKGTKLYYYTVQTGDVVGSIAERYGVSARQIASWNGLRRYRIKPGQKLKIYTTPAKAARAGSRPAASSKTTPIKEPVSSSGTYYTIRSGDTIWDIAKRYGVSVGQIQRLNGGLQARDLKVGQRIRVK